jgi:hypothetical protein
MQLQRYIKLINRDIFLLFFCTFLWSSVNGQIPFKDDKFSAVKIIDSVEYAVAKNFADKSIHLVLDIYLPDSLDNRERPLIIFSHGGSFLTGDRKSGDMLYLCNALAKKGYICASIDYRKGINVLKDFKHEFSKAIWRATQDHRTAIRFFRTSYLLGNPYHIDTSQIYLAGVSAGAIASLHAAFQTDISEIPPNISTQTLGGPFSGDHEFMSSNMKGVINLFGAISQKDYIDFPPSISICNLHGDKDKTVPYKSAIYAPNNVEIGPLHGSFVIDSIAQSLGMSTSLKTLWGKGHVPYTRDSSYIDTTLNYIVDCMLDKVKLGGIVSVEKDLSRSYDYKIWLDGHNLHFAGRTSQLPQFIEIYSMAGALVEKHRVSSGSEVIRLGSNLYGPYYLRFTKGKTGYYQKILVR